VTDREHVDLDLVDAGAVDVSATVVVEVSFRGDLVLVDLGRSST